MGFSPTKITLKTLYTTLTTLIKEPRALPKKGRRYYQDLNDSPIPVDS